MGNSLSIVEHASSLFWVTFLMDIPSQLKDKPGRFSAVGSDRKLEQTTNELLSKCSDGVIGHAKQKQYIAQWNLIYHEMMTVEHVRICRWQWEYTLSWRIHLQVISRLVQATCRYIHSHLCKIIFFQQKGFFSLLHSTIMCLNKVFPNWSLCWSKSK